MTTPRFGVMALQDAPFPTLMERWRRVEELGFDHLFVADHTGDYRDTPNGPWFDGWTVLAAMAVNTSHIRIGTLVSNPVLRPPAVLAKIAVTVDHLSGGRLELGIGTGIAPFDHQATGTDVWPMGERVGRFAEYVEVLDGLLTAAGKPYAFAGRWLRTEEASTVPGPLQQPRPPIIVAGQSPTVLRVAAERAEGWNTHGPFGAGVDEILAITRRQNHELDELCAAAGRDPASLRRGLLLFAALDPWTSGTDPTAVVERFTAAGIAEFVVSWPGDDRVGDLERLADRLITTRT